jgi:hypothetical protein
MSATDWTGTRVRKDGKEGTIFRDSNGYFRLLSVRFDDGTEDQIVLPNYGPDTEEQKHWQWYNTTEPLSNQWIGF